MSICTKAETVLTATLLGVFAVAVLVGPAHANIAPEPTASVTYRDLDLATVAGTQELNHRVAIAAKSVCSNYDGHTLADYEAAAACRKDAIARVAPTVDALVAGTAHAGR